MNVLFLTLVGNENINERGIYNDLMRKFKDEGDNVYIVSPSERREKKKTRIIKQDNITLLKIKTPNVQKTNLFEKGLSTILIEFLFLRGIKKKYSTIKFDLVLYSTPPITFTKVIKYIKNRDGAKSYLLLKDIFPQNAVDVGLIKENSIVHNFFKKKEKALYSISDHIGCMSPANVKYLVKYNPELNSKKIEVNPNSITPVDTVITQEEIQLIKEKSGAPKNSVLFVYGGNLGLPQGIDFLIEVLNDKKNNSDLFFIIVGSGTMYSKLVRWLAENKPTNTILLPGLPKKEYDAFLQCADVGMIFLDKRFTIPNFPSRLLSYLEMKKPVLIATDKNTDIGEVAESNNFGLWVESGNLLAMKDKIDSLLSSKELRERMGENGYNYLLDNYTSNHSYSIIMQHFENVQ